MSVASASIPAAESDVTATAERIFELSRLPPASVQLLRAFATGARHPDRSAQPPRWQVRLALARVDPKRLAAYRDACGFAPDAKLPILYPQVLAAPLHLHLMTRRGFPFPMTGLVHVANRFEQTRALDAGESLGLVARIAESRRNRHGVEFDIVTECVDASGQMPWRATTTALHRLPKTPEPARRAKPVEEAERSQLSRYLVFDVGADTGRRYAHASLDFNPIHISAAAARLLGFRRAIAHGMWSAARCAALLPMPAASMRRLDVRFRKPMFLPGRAVLRYSESESGYDFALLREDGAVLVEGRLR